MPIDLGALNQAHHGGSTLTGAQRPSKKPIVTTQGGRADLVLAPIVVNGYLAEDQLRYVNGTILGKVAESTTLQQQAANNSREQFANSPKLKIELQNAIIDSLDAHSAMNSKALNSTVVMDGLLDVLLNHARIYERLRGIYPGAEGASAGRR